MFGIRSIPVNSDDTPPIKHYLPRGVFGGAELAVEQLAVELAERGHTVTVYCRKGRRLTSNSNYKGVNLVSLPCIRSQSAEALSHSLIAALFASLAPKKFHGRPDIVHIHTTGPSLFAFLPRLFGLPTVVTVQGLDWKREKWGPFAKKVLKLGAWTSAKHTSATIVVSKHLEQHYLSAYNKKTFYIPNGVDIKKAANSSAFLEKIGIKPKKYLLFLARLVPEKNAHLLITAFKNIQSDMNLVIAGDASYTDKYAENLKEMAKSDPRIIMTGGVYGPDKEVLLSQAALFVLPSSVEGLSLALLEAMSYGIYPLVSDIPENTEVVLPAGGSVFRNGDAQDLAKKLEELLADISSLEIKHLHSMIENISEKYSWKNIAFNTEEIYFRLRNKKN